MKRRFFLNKVSVGACALILPHTELVFQPGTSNEKKKTFSIGIVTDVHHGMLPDTEERLEKFIEEAKLRKVDFIIQMGDFCHAESKSDHFLEIWNQFAGPKYHVLGNHDMDLNSKTRAMAYWGMEKNYYAFDHKGVRFIVLDANFLYQQGQFIDYENANFYVDDKFRTYINDEQITWFSEELKASKKPIIVFSHQSLWHYQHGVKNRLEIQKHMERYRDKIICCLNGHNHIDFHHHQNGINYLDVNSMSYQWVGDSYKTKRYSEEESKGYKWLSHVAPYKDPLYAFAKINPKGSLTVEGVKSVWLPPSPYELGMPKGPLGNICTPEISDYKIKK